jgi:hypothetical protein
VDRAFAAETDSLCDESAPSLFMKYWAGEFLMRVTGASMLGFEKPNIFSTDSPASDIILAGEDNHPRPTQGKVSAIAFPKLPTVEEMDFLDSIFATSLPI